MTRLGLCLAIVAAGLSVSGPDGETLDQRRQRVERMSDAEKADLNRRFREFSALSPEELASARRLHEQIERDPDRVHLEAVMERYCRWYESLPPFRKAELLAVKPEDRIKRVRSILDDQAKWEASRPSPQDALALTRWLDSYFARHEAEILKNMPDWFRRRMEGTNPTMRKRMLLGSHTTDITWLPQPSSAEFSQLRQSLSPEAQSRLAGQPVAEQWKTVLGWTRLAGGKQALGGAKGLRLVEEQELSRFFEEGLQDDQRDRLLSMPAEVMQHELLRLYLGQRVKGLDGAERRGKRGGAEAFPPRRKPAAERGANGKRPRADEVDP